MTHPKPDGTPILDDGTHADAADVAARLQTALAALGSITSTGVLAFDGKLAGIAITLRGMKCHFEALVRRETV